MDYDLLFGTFRHDSAANKNGRKRSCLFNECVHPSELNGRVSNGGHRVDVNSKSGGRRRERIREIEAKWIGDRRELMDGAIKEGADRDPSQNSTNSLKIASTRATLQVKFLWDSVSSFIFCFLSYFVLSDCCLIELLLFILFIFRIHSDWFVFYLYFFIGRAYDVFWGKDTMIFRC